MLLKRSGLAACVGLGVMTVAGRGAVAKCAYPHWFYEGVEVIAPSMTDEEELANERARWLEFMTVEMIFPDAGNARIHDSEGASISLLLGPTTMARGTPSGAIAFGCGACGGGVTLPMDLVVTESPDPVLLGANVRVAEDEVRVTYAVNGVQVDATYVERTD